VFGADYEMATKVILPKLAALEEAPWGDINGKPLDARGLANHLRPYGVKSGTVRLSEKDTPKGYKREHLVDAWRRYLPPAGEAPQAPQAPQPPLSAAFEAPDVADVADQDGFVADDNRSDRAEKPNEIGPVADVADVADFPGDGGNEPGLTWRTVDQLASEVEEWAYANRDTVRIDQAGVIEAEIRRRVIRAGVLPEAVAIETERVMTSLFEGWEAARAKR
jgi:hypothetical protein